MTEHIKLKHKVKQIGSKTTFMEMLDNSMLSSTEKRVMTMYYLQEHTLTYIADILGYSEQGIVKVHKRALKKLSKML